MQPEGFPMLNFVFRHSGVKINRFQRLIHATTPKWHAQSASHFVKGGREGDLAGCKEFSCRKSPPPPFCKGGLLSCSSNSVLSSTLSFGQTSIRSIELEVYLAEIFRTAVRKIGMTKLQILSVVTNYENLNVPRIFHAKQHHHQ
jgi:hypothetical protein